MRESKLRPILAALILSFNAWCALSTHAATAERAPVRFPENFLTHWGATAPIQAKTAQGEVEARSFHRFVYPNEPGAEGIPAGSVTFLKIPKAHAPGASQATPEEMGRAIQKAMGIPPADWQHRKTNGVDVFEGYWARGGYFIRAYLGEYNGSLTYSVSTYRRLYAETAGAEAEIIQRYLAGEFDRRHSALDRFFASLWIESAQAASCAGCDPSNPATFGLCMSCLKQGGSGGGAISSISGISGSLTETAGGINNMAGSLNNVAGSVNSVAGSMNHAAGQLGHFGNQLSASSAQMSASIDGMSSQIAQSTEALQQIVTPSNMARNGLAFGGGLGIGMGLGMLAVDLTVKGVTSLGAYVHELITKEKDTQQRLASFTKAREEYERSTDQVTKLQRALDSNVEILKGCALAGGCEKFLKDFRINSVTSRRLGAQLERKIDQGLDAGLALGHPCIRFATEELAKLEQLTAESRKVVEFFESNDTRRICDSSRELADGLVKIERELQRARLAVLDGEDAWVKDWNQRHLGEFRQVEQIQERSAEGATRKRVEEATRKIETLTLEDRAKLASSAYKECIHRKTPFWSRIPLLGRFMIRREVKDSCTAQAEKTASEKYAEIEKQLKDRKALAENHSQTMGELTARLKVDTGVDNKALSAHLKWIEGLAKESTAEAEKIAGIESRKLELQSYCQ